MTIPNEGLVYDYRFDDGGISNDDDDDDKSKRGEVCDLSVGTTELHFSTKNLATFFRHTEKLYSSDTRQSMKCRITTER